MDEFIIDGSHFGGVLEAVKSMLTNSRQVEDVELVCNEEEIYILRETTGKYVIATIEY